MASFLGRPSVAAQEEVERGVAAIQLQGEENGSTSGRSESRWTDQQVASTSGRTELEPQLQV